MVGDHALRTVFTNLFGFCEFTICRDGKPYIKNSPYQFNLSHSADFLLLAVGDVPVGVDVEKITEIRPKLMKKYFSKEEQEQVEKEGKKAFFEFWCQKESYAKYTGEGIKALTKSLVIPKTVGFYTESFFEYQICVCTEISHLPKQVEMMGELIL